MRLVVFSDGHVGEYLEGYTNPATGLNTRLEDTLNVWTWIHRLAIERQADAVVFGGDRFKPKRPPAWMRDLADARLIPFKESRLPLVLLEGNHDQWDKARRWNTYGGVNTWKSDEDPIWVFDKPGALDFHGVCLYLLPYGATRSDIDFSDLNPDGTNVLVFHDDVNGMSNYGLFTAKGGFDPADLDREEFLLVMGGHVHLRQELPFKHTTGFHIGSPLERIDDGDQGPKGAIILDVSGTSIEIEFVESPAPKIVRSTVSWTGDIDECVAYVENPEGNIVQLVVNHIGAVPTGLRREIVKRLRERGVRSADVKLKAEHPLPIGEVKVAVRQGTSLAEECVEWARQVTNDDKIATLLQEVIQR